MPRGGVVMGSDLQLQAAKVAEGILFWSVWSTAMLLFFIFMTWRKYRVDILRFTQSNHPPSKTSSSVSYSNSSSARLGQGQAKDSPGSASLSPRGERG